MNLLWSLILYGCAGWIVEILFTGVHSLITKNWRGTAQTYIWMAWIYGLGAISLKAIKDNIVLSDNFYLNAALMSIMLYTPLIFGIEFLSGLALKKLVGRIPWEYGPSRFSAMGLVRFDYAPYWAILGFVFHVIEKHFNKIIEFIGNL